MEEIIQQIKETKAKLEYLRVQLIKSLNPFLPNSIFEEIEEIRKNNEGKSLGIIFPSSDIITDGELTIMLKVIENLFGSEKYENIEDKDLEFYENWESEVSFYDTRYLSDIRDENWEFTPKDNFLEWPKPGDESLIHPGFPEEGLSKPDILLYYITQEINDEGTNLPKIVLEDEKFKSFTIPEAGRNKYIESVRKRFKRSASDIDKNNVDRCNWESPGVYRDNFTHHSILFLTK